MKTYLFLCISAVLLAPHLFGQDQVSKEWMKNPATIIYSLQADRAAREAHYQLCQKDYAGNVDFIKLTSDLNSLDSNVRIGSIKILGLIPENSLIVQLEDLLISDPSVSVKMECAKALRLLKSSRSVNALIAGLTTDHRRLKLECALSLASLGEKTMSLDALLDLRKSGDRNLILDTHLGYLDIATVSAVEILKQDLINGNSYISVSAGIILAELGYFRESYPTLKASLSDPDKFVRIAAMRGLAYIGNDLSVDLIRNMRNDSEILVRRRCDLILKNCQLE